MPQKWQKACSARRFLSKFPRIVGLVSVETKHMNWYLKRSDGEVYGPVDLPILQRWAMDGRVAPDDKISTDQETWAPASDFPELSMEWKVELRDGSVYGPIHLLALRDLMHDGSVSRRAKIRHKQSGEEVVACEALLFALMEREAKAQSTVAALTDQLGDAEKRIEKLQQDLKNASGIENSLRNEVNVLTAKQKVIVPAVETPPVQVQDLQEQVDKWKKLYEEAHAAAEAHEAALKRQVREPKSGDDQHDILVREVEKWKQMHERAVAQMEQMKSRQATDQPADNDTVPRVRLEDVVRKLAQTEHNYQQLLKTLNRSFSIRSSGQPVPRPDNFQRRDVS